MSSSSTPPSADVTAAILVIGDEILSGRTKDKNIGTIADMLTEIGVDLREVRIVPDVKAEIVAAVNALRARYTYLFTSGGIGPTHDDITADSVAEAFGVGIDVDPRARAMLLERHRPEDLNAARLRMARIPDGAELIANPVSKAPGFYIGNVYVMAGVPQIMAAMLDEIRPTLTSNAPVISETIEAGAIPEGNFAGELGEIAAAHATVSIGSYPSMTPEGFRNRIVVRGRDADAVAAARTAVEALLAGLRA
ncbi:molybdopterin binding domain [Methylorubrum populi BJ001]|jgi:molybdenum cofactor synthesis domain-containing protein|uniref:Molybdopterin binding domain n=1 Tax=Methylorubrum populi (strain ATCC BAA-705 / NCIMB 13946 / BJ001) TaxID=441620 RepID=B1ZJ46_METPB|nr:molybdopterin-binding protein [Methylorubrum populi]ACB78620.1 molybdopterin binding domain [Methylorubrum populi BJ001]OAH20103.1 molybdenum cofactor biosynthesis protein [Methylorubrum populi]PZP69914.1 MAG: competence/damage-inducible protein A [Methylorubrum populi]